MIRVFRHRTMLDSRKVYQLFMSTTDREKN